MLLDAAKNKQTYKSCPFVKIHKMLHFNKSDFLKKKTKNLMITNAHKNESELKLRYKKRKEKSRSKLYKQIFGTMKFLKSIPVKKNIYGKGQKTEKKVGILTTFGQSEKRTV